ncbi:MAG: LptF/LptG family permease [Planctomycetes bacterium]|nr:LptF/LptG family permease [Planctomycetota bacterium]
MRGPGTSLDRYVGRIFLGALAGAVVIFTALWMVADLTSRIDDIPQIMAEDPDLNTLATVAGLVARYFTANLPLLLHATAPFLTLVAALYTLSRLLRTNELTPMVVAGVSLYRVLRPVLLWTGAFVALVFVNQELVLPGLAHDQEHLNRRLKGKSSRELTALPIFADRLGNRYILRRFDPLPPRQSITGLALVKTGRDPAGRLVLERKVVAPTARYQERTEKEPRGWILGDGSYEEVRDAAGNPVRRPIRFLPETISRLRPELIERANLDRPVISLRECLRECRRRPSPALVQEAHRHITHPLKCLMLLLLGLPWLMRAYSRQLQIGPMLRGLVLCALFYLVDFLCLDLGNRGNLGPVAAAWLPLVAFSAVGAVLLDRIRT